MMSHLPCFNTPCMGLFLGSPIGLFFYPSPNNTIFNKKKNLNYLVEKYPITSCPNLLLLQNDLRLTFLCVFWVFDTLYQIMAIFFCLIMLIINDNHILVVYIINDRLEKTLESPLDCKEIQPVHSEGDQPWDFFGRNDAKAETPVL